MPTGNNTPDTKEAAIKFQPAPASVPSGRRVYAVGDVHGCLDPLEALHRAIGDDLARRPNAGATLIHLGDYVDRGPDSAGVVGLLAGGARPEGIETVVNLAGNHESMMLAALGPARGDAIDLWLMNGGAASLASWGVPQEANPTDWATHIPEESLRFLGGLSLKYRIGGYIFVHAGVRPDVALDAQAEEDLLWIREPFLSSTARFEGVVVHGHTPSYVPVIRPNRIGIDTGAVMGGSLTCAVLEADRVGFLAC